MAASFNKRRVGLCAYLKNHLAIIVPMFHKEGLISDKESREALDDSTSISKRADNLVAVIGSKIETNEELLKDVLRILREAKIAHTFVAIIEDELHNSQRSGSTTATNKDQPVATDQNKESQPGHTLVTQEVEVPLEHNRYSVRVNTLYQATHCPSVGNSLHTPIISSMCRHLVSEGDTLDTSGPTSNTYASSGHPHSAQGKQAVLFYFIQV